MSEIEATPVAVTAADVIRIMDRTAVFVTEGQYARMCREAGIGEMSLSEFLENYGYTAAVPCTRNGVSGWLCLQ